MATRQDGGVRKATANTVKAMRRSAESRRCPSCGRGSALRWHGDDFSFGYACRWADCGYESLTVRDWDD